MRNLPTTVGLKTDRKIDTFYNHITCTYLIRAIFIFLGILLVSLFIAMIVQGKNRRQNLLIDSASIEDIFQQQRINYVLWIEQHLIIIVQILIIMHVVVGNKLIQFNHLILNEQYSVISLEIERL